MVFDVFPWDTVFWTNILKSSLSTACEEIVEGAFRAEISWIEYLSIEDYYLGSRPIELAKLVIMIADCCGLLRKLSLPLSDLIGSSFFQYDIVTNFSNKYYINKCLNYFKLIHSYLIRFLLVGTVLTVVSKSAKMYNNEAIPTTLESMSSASIIVIESPAEWWYLK